MPLEEKILALFSINLFFVPFVFGQFRLPLYDEMSKNPFGKKIKTVINGVDLCKGPKRLDCGVNKFEHKPGDFSNLTFTLTFPRAVNFQKFKMVMWHEKNNTAGSRTPDIVRWIENPCSHFFFKSFLSTFFNVSPSCRVNKGTYVASFDLRSMFYDFFGLKFFYGKYQTVTWLLDKTCNIMCTNTSFTLIDDRQEKPETKLEH